MSRVNCHIQRFNKAFGLVLSIFSIILIEACSAGAGDYMPSDQKLSMEIKIFVNNIYSPSPAVLKVGDTLGFEVSVDAQAGFSSYTVSYSSDGGLQDQLQDNSLQKLGLEEGTTSVVDTSVFFVTESLEGKTLTFSFEAFDLIAQELSKTVEFEVAYRKCKIQSAVLLFAPTENGASPTFYSIQDDSTYTLDQIDSSKDTISGRIELGYYFGTEANLVSPSAYLDFTNLEGEYNDPAHGLPAWVERVETKMVMMNNVDITEISTVVELETILDNVEFESALPYVEKVEKNNIYAFSSSTGISGIIRVVDLLPGSNADDYITLEFILTEATE